MKKKRNKIRTNKDFCPTCNEEWKDCTCEDIYPEQSLIDQDDQNIEDSFNTY